MNLVSLQQCPVCRGTIFENHLTCKDHTTSQETFTIASCKNCGLLATTPRPRDEHLHRYYLSPDYISHTGSSKSIIDKIYLLARTRTIRWKYRTISEIKSSGTILDYGCGTGEFLHQMQKADWQVMGVEPSSQARSRANHLLTTNTVVPTLVELSNSKFDVITMWHVYEHVAEPTVTLDSLKHRLKRDGVIFVAVPNHESYDANYYQEFWAGYDVPRHLWHFSQVTLQKLFENCGLKLQQILPMKLDAFYVSLLSEKYKNPKSEILSTIRGFYQGFLSNQKAKRNNNYSSLIYVFRHS